MQNLLISFFPCTARRQLECQSAKKVLFSLHQTSKLLKKEIVKLAVLRDWSSVTSRSKTKLYINYVYSIIQLFNTLSQ